MIRHLLVRLSRMPRGSRLRSRGRRSWEPEGLENRLLLSGNPTVYTVDLLGDAGMGTSEDAGDLRYVIGQANMNNSRDGSVIQFDPILFATAQDIELESPGTLTLSETPGPEVIDGPATNNVSIDGVGDYGDFQVNSGVTATLSHLNIINGVNAGPGGGIDNSGTLTVAGCVIGNNTAGQSGGGIDNSGTLTVAESTILSNTVQGGGGGIYNSGELTITGSSILANSASNDGGGIDNSPDSNNPITLTVSESTIAGNVAGVSGGGIDNNSLSDIFNGTIVENRAVKGGGIANAGTLMAVNDTIVGNLAGGVAGTAGGLYNNGQVHPGTATLDNTIVIRNSFFAGSTQQTPSDIVGDVSSASAFNLIGTGGAGGMTDGNDGNQVGVGDLQFGQASPYQLGGAPLILPPLPGSPAVDRGSNSLAVDPTDGQPLTTDGRGAGFDRISNGTVDIGAYELQVPAVVTAPPPVATMAVPTTIVAEDSIFAGKGSRRRHLIGFELYFSAATDPVRSSEIANYLLTQTVRHGRKLIAQPVAFRAAYDATARVVTLTLAGRPKFTKGGRLVVVAAAPGGIADAAGVALDGGNRGVPGDDGTFVVAPKGITISR